MKDDHNSGWYVVDRNHNNMRHRGPYRLAETASAIRTEMEAKASDTLNERWNLCIDYVGDVSARHVVISMLTLGRALSLCDRVKASRQNVGIEMIKAAEVAQAALEEEANQ